MKALVVYESMFGNSETIARAVAEGLGGAFDVTVADVAGIPDPTGTDLLVVGGPTHAFGLSRPATRAEAAKQDGVRPGAAEVGLREYLAVCPTLTGLAAATFDTKVDKRLLPGSAARNAYHRLSGLGCRMVLPAETFRVGGTPGPLVAGEADRARRWATELAARFLADRHTV
jgi:hypothetical protein